MKKLTAAINMTLDGFCSHDQEGIVADDETHQHYSDLLKGVDTVVYGRTTYQLMENHWPLLVKNPSGNKASDDFAMSLENITKVVFSNTLKEVTWKNSRIATRSLKDELLALKQEPGKGVLIGSPGLITSAMNLDVIDEYQFAVHPVIAGKGLSLFKNIQQYIPLELIKTKTFRCGMVVLYYKPAKR